MNKRTNLTRALVIGSVVSAGLVLAGCPAGEEQIAWREDPTTTTPADATTTTAGPTTTEPADADPSATQTMAEITSSIAVSNGPTAPSVVELPDTRVTSIVTYHWNDAKGAAPGTIGLRAGDGTLYGPFESVGRPGQGGVPNAFWEAEVDLDLRAGTYTVEDSDPSTWSWAPDTGGRGIVQIIGR